MSRMARNIIKTDYFMNIAHPLYFVVVYGKIYLIVDLGKIKIAIFYCRLILSLIISY